MQNTHLQNVLLQSYLHQRGAPMWEFAAKVHYHIEMIATADRAGFQTIPRVSALTLQH